MGASQVSISIQFNLSSFFTRKLQICVIRLSINTVRCLGIICHVRRSGSDGTAKTDQQSSDAQHQSFNVLGTATTDEWRRIQRFGSRGNEYAADADTIERNISQQWQQYESRWRSQWLKLGLWCDLIIRVWFVFSQFLLYYYYFFPFFCFYFRCCIRIGGTDWLPDWLTDWLNK